MDAIDRKILQALQANGRAGLQDIGQQVGLSASPCWERIRKLEQSGVIEGFTVRLNAQALGWSDTVLVQLTLDSHTDNTLEKFGEVLATIPEVVEAYLVSGEYDYLLRVAVREALQDQGHPPQQVQLRAADPEKGRFTPLIRALPWRHRADTSCFSSVVRFLQVLSAIFMSPAPVSARGIFLLPPAR